MLLNDDDDEKMMMMNDDKGDDNDNADIYEDGDAWDSGIGSKGAYRYW